MNENEVKEFVNDNTETLVGVVGLAGLLCVAYKLGKANGRLKGANEVIKLAISLGRNQ